MENIRKAPLLEEIILQHYLPVSRAALAITLTTVTILSLLPVNNFSGMDLRFWRLPVAADKIAHCIAFLVISGLIDGFCYQDSFNLKKASIAVLYGIWIEGLQSLTDYRHLSFWDMVANCIGIGIYWLLIPAFKITPVLRVRWQYKERLSEKITPDP
ncbi:VanZ family protein [Endozoicomonas sp. SCSIO W0465]|uniref:VanZ family protein n=1 Tax=Endozoicomonas sp. SCSIO W0465 TaxID=2918516 RepID=UPI002074E49C|nr:VanZ family protein [Endozoicomonas sp. SCSIO W0465]USE35390.1 VanZ family protein [Endozoicomonas sp. SCSIO W0465]